MVIHKGKPGVKKCKNCHVVYLVTIWTERYHTQGKCMIKPVIKKLKHKKRKKKK